MAAAARTMNTVNENEALFGSGVPGIVVTSLCEIRPRPDDMSDRWAEETDCSTVPVSARETLLC